MELRKFLVAAVLIVACGSPPPTYKTSVGQAASIEARDAGPLRHAITFEDSCKALECSFIVNVDSRYGKIADYAATLSADLKAAKPVAPEVSRLTDDTVRATDRISSSFAAFHSCLWRTRNAQSCGAEWEGAESAWRALPSVLDGWRPYGG